MGELLIYIVPALAVIGLIYTAFKARWVNKQDAGNEKMKGLSDHIHEGALAFLSAEYRILGIFVVVAGALLGFVSTIVETTHWFIVVAFVIGALFSAVAGNIGMRIATRANVRTTQAARTSLPDALKVSFGGGTVMGLGVAGLAVFGLSALFIVLFMWFMGGTFTEGTFLGSEATYSSNELMTFILEALAGFSLGAESIALFARVGGGIYTKAADVGADLVGKVEANIPEDDPRNPATIADNVGDNVGDVAGMGADLFGSYVATVLAAMVLGNYVVSDMGGLTGDEGEFLGMGPILLPLVIAGLGIIFSIIGTWFVKISDNNAKEAKVQRALNLGNWGSILLTVIACFFLTQWMLPDVMDMKFFGVADKVGISSLRVFGAVVTGLFVGGMISYFTEFYTGLGKKPVMSIVQSSSTGAATNIIGGLSVGMISTFSSVLLFAAAIWVSYAFAGFYGVAIAASAMMATTAMQLAIDAFGPIADNAGGIAEMAELPDEVRERTDILDSVGNTTAAVGKGFAIASAALTALALFAAYVTFTGINGINIFKAPVLSALFIGGMIPVVFSALAMKSVGKAAMEMVKEVRRQFKEIPGIMEGTGKPEYGKCVDISTKAALKEMMLPGALTIITPLLIAFVPALFGYTFVETAEILGGYMAGVTVSGVLWAIFQNNAGGAWDNAKKSFEAGVEIDGEMTYKGSEAHKAAVTGDTVGDPFKDTSGPSMNILIKLTCLIGLIIAPILGHQSEGHDDEAAMGTSTELNYDINNLQPCDCFDIVNAKEIKEGKYYDKCQELKADRVFFKEWNICAANSIPGNLSKSNVIKLVDAKYNIQPDQSEVSWSAKKIAKRKPHFGKVPIVEGFIMTGEDEIKRGELTISVADLTNEDIEDADKRDKLVGHLKSADFFDVETHPKAMFVVKSDRVDGQMHHVTGDLTIKGITKEIVAKLKANNNGPDNIVLSGTIVFDRTDFDIKYNSGSFFKDLGDNAIKDEVLLRFDIKGTTLSI